MFAALRRGEAHRRREMTGIERADAEEKTVTTAR